MDPTVETKQEEDTKEYDTGDIEAPIYNPNPTKATMSNLWSQDTRPRASYKSFPESRTYKLRSELASTNYALINEIVKLMVGNRYITNINDSQYGSTPFLPSSKLWIGNGIDQSNNEQGIVPSSGGTKFERRLIFETLDTYPVINPQRSTTGNPPPVASVNIPNTQVLVGVSTRYSSRIVNNDGIVSANVIDDACGYWLFDVTNPISTSTFVPVYLLLANFHGLTTLYSGRVIGAYQNSNLTYASANLIASVNPTSLLDVSGLSYLKHLDPFNKLATLSPERYWTLNARFDFVTNTFQYTRTRSAHPAIINFIGSQPFINKNTHTKLYGTIKTEKSYSLSSDTPNDYIISINCATHVVNPTCVSIIQVIFKSGVVKNVTGKGSLDEANKFTSDNGFHQVQVNSGEYIENLVITSATDNTTKSYGGNGGKIHPIEPQNIIDVLKNNNTDFNVNQSDLRLVSINGTYGDVINQAKFTFAPVSFQEK